MIAGRIANSLIVGFVTGASLAAVWFPGLFGPAYDFLSATRNELLTGIFLVVSLVVLVCVWCRKRSGTRPQACCSDETDECRKKEYAALPCPYPQSYPRGASIAEFRYESHLYLLRLKQRLAYTDREEQYIVAKDYSVGYKLKGVNNWEKVTVPRGTLTDLSSSPGPARIFVGRVGLHLEASIVHDYLYIAWQVKNVDPTEEMRRFADDLMLAAMKNAGMGCKADLIYRGIRLFGKSVFVDCNPEPLILCSKKLPKCCADKEEEGAECVDGHTQSSK